MSLSHICLTRKGINGVYSQAREEVASSRSQEKNLEFLKLLTSKYILIDSENFKEINFNELKNYVIKKLSDFVAFDIFIVSKNIYHP